MYVPGLFEILFPFIMEHVCWQLEATEVASFLLQIFNLSQISATLRSLLNFST